MTATEQDYLDQLADAVAAKVLAALDSPRDDRPLLRLAEVADRLGISVKSVKDLVNGRDGNPPKLASFRVGPAEHSRVVAPADLDAYIAERKEVG